MKKIYSLMALFVLGSGLRAQVACVILEPPSIAGAVVSTYAQQANAWDAVPDMTVLANAVTDTLALAYDGSAADSLCCEPVVNGAEIAGKIAVIYRGTCNFSIKAYEAQQAGAVGVIIISNSALPLINPSGGTNQEFVTIPVFLIEQAAGAAIRAEMDAGSIVVGYLGTTVGLFANDVGMAAKDMLMPPQNAIPALLCQNASEYSAQLGAWVFNFGNADQTGVTLNVDVLLNGSSIWNNTSDPVDILAGDSAFLQVDDFSQPSYGGHYTINYTANLPSGDEFGVNNNFSTTLNITDVFSYSRVNETTGKPISAAGYKPNPGNGEFVWCATFLNANASRMAVTGIESFAATNATSTTPTLDGQLLTIKAFEWLDAFTGLSDPNLALDNLNEVGFADFIIEQDTTFWQGYIPFVNPITLTDNQRYLFCLSTTNTDVFLGGDATLDYTTNESIYDQPTTPLQNGVDWSIGFVATQSSNAVRMIDVNTIGITENSSTKPAAFPNPVNDMLRIPLRSFTGAADLRVVDLNGRVVSTQRVSATGSHLLVNTHDIASGTYTFEVAPVNGARTSFKVVVSH